MIEEKGVHNHPSDPTIARQALSNSIKRKAIENICDKPSKLIHSELRTNEFSEEIHSNDIDCMRRNLYIARRKLTPALPKSQEEVVSVIEQLNPITHKEEKFLNVLINIKYCCFFMLFELILPVFCKDDLYGWYF